MAEKDILTELREMTDSASLLLDVETYSEESRRQLIASIASAKVALQNRKDEEGLLAAYEDLCNAVDSLETVSGKSRSAAGGSARQPADKACGFKGKAERRKSVSLRTAAPYLICGAAIVGSAAFLVGSIAKKPAAKKERFWERFTK